MSLPYMEDLIKRYGAALNGPHRFFYRQRRKPLIKIGGKRRMYGEKERRQEKYFSVD